MSMRIRIATPEDAYEYVLVNLACWRAAYRDIMPAEYLDARGASIQQQAEDYKGLLRDPGDFVYYCIEFEEKMVGRLILCKSRDADKPDAGEVAAIYLLEAFWGKGYGKEMMDHAVLTLKSLGYKEILL